MGGRLLNTLKAGAVVTYRDKPFLVLYVSNFGYVEIREYHEEKGRTGWLTGPIERVRESELTKLDLPAG
jgi:hypothetical protein